ncbi:peptide/nickel transport system permease protein [Saccharopolyspora spinosa]|uniref:Peptide/nickel transport system permease protein n=3 Tax=Saccharopolyspora spinosa TaxID=60894 RepID=A0A2N3Y692_SACSN|nr:peptide/nickel transport system permease protein [Saccharopolyspora spinosa]
MAAGVVQETASPKRPALSGWLSTLTKPTHVTGVVIVGVVVFCAIFADLISPHDPILADPHQRYLALFSPGHVLGTDELGRDVLSRLIHGARFALFVAVAPTLIALVIGGLIGLMSGYVGGKIDAVIMRVFDVVFAFPGVLLALGIGAALGAGMVSMIIAMVVVTIPEVGRLVRGSVLGEKEQPYVESALTLGLGHFRTATLHVAPNVVSPLVVIGALQTGKNVILAASLSFLGLGVKPPTPDWGAMLNGGRAALLSAPHVATLAGLAIVTLTVGFNLVGDAVRDHLDPRVRNNS